MNTDSEDYLKLQAHLGALTSYGRHYVGIMETAAVLLHSEHLKETTLSADEKNDLLNMLVDTAKKHMELIEWSIKDRSR